MTAITFPRSVTTGTEFVANNGVTYYWAGNRWAQSTHNRVKYVHDGSNAAHVYNSATDSTLDGGLADNRIVATVTTSSLYSGYCNPYFGQITYTIDISNAQEAVLEVHGLTVDHNQSIDVAYSQGEHTEFIPVLDYQLWNQVASVTLYVIDGSNYVHSIPVTDAWEVAYGPCLVAGTLMSLADGSQKKIEDVTHNDVLSVWNFDLGEPSEARPLWVKQAQTANDYTLLKFSNGTELRTVGHHIFNKQAGEFTRITTDDTPMGTITVNEHGEEITIVSKELIKETVNYYNIWTQYHLNAYANGVLTGNRYCNIYPVVDMKYVKDDRALRSVEEFAGIDSKYISGMRLQEQTFDLAFIQTMVDRIEALDIKSVATA
jgi:hypothetical protein